MGNKMLNEKIIESVGENIKYDPEFKYFSAIFKLDLG